MSQNPNTIIAYPNLAIKTTLNITTATVIKALPGYIYRVNVTVAGSAAGSLSDTATVGGVAAANLIAVLPNTVGFYQLEFPAKYGIVVTPGTGQTISISWL